MLEIIIGTIIGGGLSILATFLNNKSNAKIQKELLEFQKETASSVFQKETLIELQDVLIIIVRLHSKAFVKSKMIYKEQENWMFTYEDEVDDKIGESNRRFFVLLERISNTNIRNELNHFNHIPNSLIFSEGEDEAFEGIKDLLDKHESINELIGLELRKL